jgi:hypothetical protein
MKQRILQLFALTVIVSISTLHAQKNTAFAVTAPAKGNFNWNVIREIDLATGEVIRTLYDPAVNKSVNYKGIAGDQLTPAVFAGSAAGSSAAAAAYDASHNRLYFTTMRGNSLMYIDLSSPTLDIVLNNSVAFNTGNKNDEANVITRMAFGADGHGYALTNDGKGFLRFTTDQKPTVTNLGELIDGAKNGAMSVHSQCSSWGGDIVGDAYGNLYLVSYRNHVFKINPTTRIADYLGQLKGVPAQFTSNGVVVSNDGDLIVTSATQTDNYYRVNVSTMVATPVQKKESQVFNSSDLANGNLLYQNKGFDKVVANEIRGNEEVSVFPNPVPNKTFSLQFDKMPAGKYNFVLSDASGRSVVSKAITVSMNGQIENVNLPRTLPGGMFMVKLVGGDNKVVLNNKIVVQ